MMSKSCQLCGTENLTGVLDLGHHPLADTFLKKEQLSQQEIIYPLRVLLCDSCGYATLEHIVPEEKRYQENDYSYTAANSPVSLNHFEEMAQDIADKTNLQASDLAIDIGSNDGTLLKAIKQKTNCRIIGVEPSKNIAQIADDQKIFTINRLFDAQAVEEIRRNGPAKVIACTNVFNHITDLPQFMNNILKIIDDAGYFVFEVPYLLDLMNNHSFDTVYLEHVSYFGVKPLDDFFKRLKLKIFSISNIAYMGGSLRIYAAKHTITDQKIDDFLRREEESHIYDIMTYKIFMEKIEKMKFNLCQQLYNIKARNEKIIAIGAAAKGNTLLNYCKIDNQMIEFVTDNSPLKVNKFLPGSHIPIKSDNDITKDIKHALILPWNISDYLKERLKHLNLNFIIPQI